jgi:hypothetical protein
VSDTVVKGISTLGFTRLPSLKGRFPTFTGIYSSVTYVCDNASISALACANLASRFQHNITDNISVHKALSDLLQLLPPEPFFEAEASWFSISVSNLKRICPF